jgi:hypothetical protein
MTRARSPGGYTDGSVVLGTELETIDEGQHTAVKGTVGAVYTITGNPVTFSGKGARVAGDGLFLDSADGPAYSGGMAMAPLKREFVLEPNWRIPSGESPWNWEAGGFVAAQKANTAYSVMFVLRLQSWHKQKLRRLRVRVKGGSGHTDGNIASMTKPRFVFAEHDLTSANLDDIIGLTSVLAGTWYNDASTTAAGYEAVHWIDTGADALNTTIDCYTKYYSLFLQGESGSGSIAEPNFLGLSVAATFDIATKPFG